MKSSRLRASAHLASLATALAGTTALAGCSSEGGGDWLAVIQAARTSWEERDASVKLQDAADIPYATLGMRIDGGREQILILATDAGGERLWASAAHIAVSTRNGRIVRTAGFGADLSGYAVFESSRESWTQPHTYNWAGDFADLGYFSVPVTCDVRPGGRDPITILGKRFDTVRVDETCRAEKLDWTFSNSYWVSLQSGTVWRSQVHFHPNGPALDIEILRPPLGSQ